MPSIRSLIVEAKDLMQQDHAEKLKDRLDRATRKTSTKQAPVHYEPPGTPKAMKMARKLGWKIHGAHAKNPEHSFYAKDPGGKSHQFYKYETGIGPAWSARRVRPSRMALKKRP